MVEMSITYVLEVLYSFYCVAAIATLKVKGAENSQRKTRDIALHNTINGHLDLFPTIHPDSS